MVVETESLTSPPKEDLSSSSMTFLSSSSLLLSSYVIALLLTTVFHEGGHALALALISIPTRLVLNPFSNSMAMPLRPIPQDFLVSAVAAGTIVELLFGTSMLLILWRFRIPRFVPLLACGPISYLKSGGYFLVGTSVEGGDTALMLSSGIPELLIYSLGLIFIIVGSITLLLLFPLLGIGPDISFRSLFGVLLIGLIPHGIGMIIYAQLSNPLGISIGIANVLFMLMTVTILTSVYVKKSAFFDRISHTRVSEIDRTGLIAIISFALILIIVELLLFN